MYSAVITSGTSCRPTHSSITDSIYIVVVMNLALSILLWKQIVENGFVSYFTRALHGTPVVTAVYSFWGCESQVYITKANNTMLLH